MHVNQQTTNVLIIVKAYGAKNTFESVHHMENNREARDGETAREKEGRRQTD